jgi:hypothetical protein
LSGFFKTILHLLREKIAHVKILSARLKRANTNKKGVLILSHHPLRYAHSSLSNFSNINNALLVSSSSDVASLSQHTLGFPWSLLYPAMVSIKSYIFFVERKYFCSSFAAALISNWLQFKIAVHPYRLPRYARPVGLAEIRNLET